MTATVRDAHQVATWYCASGDGVFRSVNDAGGWERVATTLGERVERLCVLPGRHGVIVATTRVDGSDASALYASADNGDSWQRLAAFEFHVEGLALGVVDSLPHAFLATDQGLFRQALVRGRTAERVVVDSKDPAAGCYSVACVVDPSGTLGVMVAMQQLRGMFWSGTAGRSQTFTPAGMAGRDVRVLATQATDVRRFVYAGAYATGESEGDGVHRVELRDMQVDAQGWQPVADAWRGGSCLGVAVFGESVIAATARSGVTVAREGEHSEWRVPLVDCGLPLRETGGGFEQVTCVAVGEAPPVLAGGPRGMHRSDGGRAWTPVSTAVFTERVTLPSTWLFVSGDHDLTVTYDDPRTG